MLQGLLELRSISLFVSYVVESVHLGDQTVRRDEIQVVQVNFAIPRSLKF